MTTPNQPAEGDFPEEAPNQGTGAAAGLASWSVRSEESWREGTRQPFRNSFDPIGAFRGFLTQALQGLVAGPLQFISDLIGMRWDQVDGQGSHLADIETRTQELEGVIGYGSSYMNSASLTPGIGWSKLPFRQAFGPMVGMVHDNGLGGGFYILGSKGLWEVSYKAVFDVLLGPVNTDMWLSCAVYTPGGGLYDRQSIKSTSSGQVTLGETTRFVVPTSGYRMQVEAQCGTAYRTLLASREYSSFNVIKISNETS